MKTIFSLNLKNCWRALNNTEAGNDDTVLVKTSNPEEARTFLCQVNGQRDVHRWGNMSFVGQCSSTFLSVVSCPLLWHNTDVPFLCHSMSEYCFYNDIIQTCHFYVTLCQSIASTMTLYRHATSMSLYVRVFLLQ